MSEDGGNRKAGYNSRMQTTTFDIEKLKSPDGGRVVIGVDEVGRGPLAGPVVAAAVCFKDPLFVIPDALEKEFSLIRDSKKLSEKQREKIFDLIQEYFFTGIGIISPETIDRVNILEATFLAMKAAVSSIKKQLTTNNQQKSDQDFFLLVDGNQAIPHLSLAQEAIIGGDGISKSIAAASIIAKVTRDRMMDEYAGLYPVYGFDQHKGYGTKVHMDALRKHGPCPLHRMSFKPVQLAIPENINKRFSNVLKPKR